MACTKYFKKFVWRFYYQSRRFHFGKDEDPKYAHLFRNCYWKK